VWPLFTGWAAVGEYRYHQAFAGYSNLRSNALLALDGSLGHVAEVLSGDYYQPLSTNSPHQIWSAAMVVSPILRGMMGVDVDAQTRTVSFAPHVPAEWKSFAIDNLRVGATTLAFSYQRAPGFITLEVKRTGSGDCTVDFSPAISLRSQVASVEVNGRAVAYRADANQTDQHVSLRAPVGPAGSTIRMRLKSDFGLSAANVLPALGSASEGLRVLSQEWNTNHTQLTLSVSGRAGRTYEMVVWNPAEVAAVKGGKLGEIRQNEARLTVEFPEGNSEAYVGRDVVMSFAGAK
jgi:hypothetical protein